MGCDIHVCAERKGADGNFEDVNIGDALCGRSYGEFAFLAGVRNYSGVQPIAEPRGFPEDAASTTAQAFDDWGCDAHTPSWLTVDELLAFDYSASMEDRRVTRQIAPGLVSGGCTCEPGEGKAMTWREFLGEWFFRDLEAIKAAGAERIVFWFDN